MNNFSKNFRIILQEYPEEYFTSLKIDAIINKNLHSYYESQQNFKNIDKFKTDFTKVWHSDHADSLDQYEQFINYGKQLANKYNIEESIINNATNYQSFDEIKYGIISADFCNLRVLPTNNSYLNQFEIHDQRLHQFDQLQNSGLNLGLPIAIFNLSEDGKWAFVKTSEESKGFIEYDKFAYVSEEQKQEFLEYDLCIVNKHLEKNLRYGTILPISSEENLNTNYNYDENFEKLLRPTNDAEHNLIWQEFCIEHENIDILPLAFNGQNILKTINALMDLPYAWGDYNPHPFSEIHANTNISFDCSGLVKAYFNTFGVHMNRNSNAQINQANVTKIEINEESFDKKKFIIDHAEPFKSMLYMPGHIMLYCGTDENENITVFHNMWAVNAQDKEQTNQYKIVFGKSILSDINIDQVFFGENEQNFSPVKKNYVDLIDFIGNIRLFD